MAQLASSRPAPGTGRLLLLASATGAGPLRAMLAALPAGTVTIIYRSAGPADPALSRELHAIAESRGARAYYLPGGGPAAPGPLSPPHVRALIPVLSRHAACLCGPPVLTAAAAAALTAAGIPPHKISRTAP